MVVVAVWPPLSLPHTRRTLSSLAPASVPAPDTPSPPLPPLEYVTYPAPREGAHEGPPRARIGLQCSVMDLMGMMMTTTVVVAVMAVALMMAALMARAMGSDG